VRALSAFQQLDLTESANEKGINPLDLETQIDHQKLLTVYGKTPQQRVDAWQELARLKRLRMTEAHKP
jgi:hypothetical protein